MTYDPFLILPGLLLALRCISSSCYMDVWLACPIELKMREKLGDIAAYVNTPFAFVSDIGSCSVL